MIGTPRRYDALRADRQQGGNNGESYVTANYTARGLLKSIGSAYGPLIESQKVDAEGKTLNVVYGGLEKTTVAYKYYPTREVSDVLADRKAAALWTSKMPPAGYTPPAPGTAEPTTQLVLAARHYVYDEVKNPTSVSDGRDPSAWPSGAKPVAKSMEYDDQYRLTRVGYAYPGGSDAQRSVVPESRRDAGLPGR